MSGGEVVQATDMPITTEELLRRGCDAELEGRALDVVLRCGWPRPGDPLGIFPCIPVPKTMLEGALKIINLDDGGDADAKLKDIRVFLDGLLERQTQVVAIYDETRRAQPPPKQLGAGG